jgi:hypothetical protein
VPPAQAGRLDAQAAPADVGWFAVSSGPSYLIHPISGHPHQPGLYRYYVKALPYTSLGAHRHSATMRGKVLAGRVFIVMGNLDSARVQRLDAGTTFVIPAGAWHAQWFESETLMEIEVMTPYQTERASPETPRTP